MPKKKDVDLENEELEQEEFEDEDSFDEEIPEGVDSVYGPDQRDEVMEKYEAQQKEETIAAMKEAGATGDEIKEFLGEEGEEKKKDEEENEEKEGDDDENAGEHDDDDEGGEAKKDEGKADEKDTEKKAEDETGDQAGDGEPRELTEAELLPKTVKVKVNGQEMDVTVETMRKSFQLEGHLTQQLQQVSGLRNQVLLAQKKLQDDRKALEQEYVGYEASLFTPEQIEARKQQRKIRDDEKNTSYQNRLVAYTNTLRSRHPDANTLDVDPDYIAFRTQNAPFVSEQLLTNQGPEAFFPALDITMQWYKDVKVLWEALQQAQDATKQITEERTKELEERKAEQREQKKRASKDVRPSTEAKGKGDDETTEGPKDYVRRMNKKRLTAQGL